jgi:hypothetical protein
MRDETCYDKTDREEEMAKTDREEVEPCHMEMHLSADVCFGV